MIRPQFQWNCMQPKECSTVKVIAFGNVIVSHTAYLEDTKLLDRYKLTLNSKSDMDAETLSEITAEVIVNKEQHEANLGGSAMRTVCVLKYLGTEPLFFGACGNDEHAEVVHDLLRNLNMDRRLQTIPGSATGCQISLIHKDEMSLYNNSGASSEYKISHLQEVEKQEGSAFLRPPNRKQIIYIEGFFVPKCEAVTTFIVQNYINNRRYLALNLSADYIVRLNFAHMLFLVNSALLIFGNKDEFETFRECWGASSLLNLAKDLTGNSKSPKILVITNGSEGVELITNYVGEKSSPGQINVQTFKVSSVNNVKNTTGCGDIFVAAFLHTWLKKRSLSQCVRVAIFRATKYLQKGCRLPSIEVITDTQV